MTLLEALAATNWLLKRGTPLKEIQMKEATPEEYLLWFFQYADFGPADGDVRLHMEQRFEEKTGKRVPKNYRYSEDS